MVPPIFILFSWKTEVMYRVRRESHESCILPAEVRAVNQTFRDQLASCSSLFCSESFQFSLGSRRDQVYRLGEGIVKECREHG